MDHGQGHESRPVWEWYWEKRFPTPPKISSTIPGSWMVSGHCGMILDQGGVAWVTLSGEEVSGANAKHPGIIPDRVEPSKCSQIEISKMNKIFSESANILLERSYTRLDQNPPRVTRRGRNHPPWRLPTPPKRSQPSSLLRGPLGVTQTTPPGPESSHSVQKPSRNP